MNWHYGDVIERIAPFMDLGDPALIHGKRVITWPEFDRRSNNLGRALRERGAKAGDKVAFYLRNRPEYMEGVAACLKARLVHVNINYRYEDEEIAYILDNSDAQAVIFAGEYAPRMARLKPRLGKVKSFIEVSDDQPTDVGESYEALAGQGTGTALGLARSPDDLLFLYTGGTTGMPKGVMWPMGDLREALVANARVMGLPVPSNWDEHVAAMREKGRLMRIIPACPLMHGTGLFSSIPVLAGGGAVITLTAPHFDAHELWAAVERHKATNIAIVGDAFAKPMLKALDAAPGKYDLSSLQIIGSSGVMWSMEVKRGLLKHIPQVVLADSFGASEAVGFGNSYMSAAGEVSTAKFSITENTKVFTADEREVAPGSGEPGFVARKGPLPLGYYKDAEKTAKTFRTIRGVRYSIPGDWCLVEADGTITLLGRGSVSINTGGEKVFPEEVEEAIKEIAGIEDALVVGVPDERWGQAVTAVIQAPGGSISPDVVKGHLRARLAAYKVPKHVLFSPTLWRAPNGKADYKRVTEHAKSVLIGH